MRGYVARTVHGRVRLRGAAPRRPHPPVGATVRELTLVLAAVGALLTTLWLGYEGARNALTIDPVAMPVPVAHTRTLEPPMTIDIAVDESGSMSESDPHGDRWKSVAALLRWLTRYQRATDLVTLTRFADTASAGPTMSARRIPANPLALAPAPSGGGTAFVPVVDAAREIFGRPPPTAARSERIILIVTDGDADDRADAVVRLPRVADHVFVIALDRSKSWATARKTWEHTGFSVMTVSNKAPNEVGAALARAILRVTGEKAKDD
jgi:hypothetical protein